MGKIRREENALWSFAPHDISVILMLMQSLPYQVSAVGGAYVQPNIAARERVWQRHLPVRRLDPDSHVAILTQPVSY